ncbi:ATP-binding protein [Candidatus Saccharibacteria bacterium]|nr:MAG: ATP-binding protein [Candidatus Saccharibacteria bacterium]
MIPFIVTIIGAESTGKTCLSRELAQQLSANWVPEFARSYLETTDGQVTPKSMKAIWWGQRALQHEARRSLQSIVIQDTDLYATVGYWQLPHVRPVIRDCPKLLEQDAASLKSNLYLITKSNIPFEPDPLRYGGDTRESHDDYWIDLCERYQLPYAVVESAARNERLSEAISLIRERST